MQLVNVSAAFIVEFVSVTILLFTKNMRRKVASQINRRSLDTSAEGSTLERLLPRAYEQNRKVVAFLESFVTEVLIRGAHVQTTLCPCRQSQARGQNTSFSRYRWGQSQTHPSPTQTP